MMPKYWPFVGPHFVALGHLMMLMQMSAVMTIFLLPEAETGLFEFGVLRKVFPLPLSLFLLKQVDFIERQKKTRGMQFG